MAEKIKKTKGGAIKGFIAVGVIVIFFLIIGGIVEFVKVDNQTIRVFGEHHSNEVACYESCAASN